MISRFFIDHPIFASVLSIVIVIAGGVAAFTLPVAQYPEITPPTVNVTCSYPGASAQVVADTVAAPIEQQVNGVENMLYMSSNCTNDGAYNLNITFKLGTDLNMAQVLVQNRVSMAMPTLPDVVKATGVITKKKSPMILLVVNLLSPDQRYDQLYLSNYATIQIKDELARLPGVGDVSFLGQQDYSMRVWLDPDKMASFQLTADDVVNALKEQNVQVAAGQIGQPPIPAGQRFQYVLSTLGRLKEPEQFAEIIVKTGSKGQITRLRDVGRIELGAKNQDQACTLDGGPAVGIAIFQLPGSNALDTAKGVRAKMDELKKRFPDGLDYRIVYDTTPFISESIHEVFKTLRDAFILVAIVILVFLQSWRSTLIAMIAIPVSLIGTFAIMAVLGFSLNNLSLFGLVLAIGIVVDDAIVVVENVERWIEHGLSPKEAAKKSMDEVTVAVIAIAFGLSAVFIPTAFLSGITGQFFRQFALTIATSTLISAFNSLTLSPALAALLLKPHEPGKHREVVPRFGVALVLAAFAGWLGSSYLHQWIQPFAATLPDRATWVLAVVAGAIAGLVVGCVIYTPVNRLLGLLFTAFNAVFNKVTAIYGRLVGICLRGAVVAMLVYFGLLGATYFGFKTVPTGFIPSQDKGYLLVNAQLPDAASLERSREVLAKMEAIARQTPGVAHTVGIAGMSFLLSVNGSNFVSMFITLDEFEHRHDFDRYADVIAFKLRRAYYEKIPEAVVGVFGAPPVDGLGTAGGFKIMVEDRGDSGLSMLQGQVDNLIEKGNQAPELAGMFSMFRANTPQYYIDIDRTKCKTLGIPLNNVFDTLQVYLGGYYVNDFNRFGRTWQVNLQADQKFRVSPEQMRSLKVRNPNGDPVPLTTLARVERTSGPVMITRYNMYPAVSINGNAKPGISSGQAIAIVDQLAGQELAPSMTTEWTELTYMQILAGNTAILIFPLCILFVFLTHSAEYESWFLPLAIIMIVPMSLLCALGGVYAMGMDNNLFTQIGFIVLAGLACKNAVLIVEFAKQQHEHGLARREAAIEASRLRLRPIIMTSFAFILGVVPLVLGKGAGAEMRRTLGTAVFSGMIGVTFFGIFLTPVFYYVLQAIADRRERKKEQAK